MTSPTTSELIDRLRMLAVLTPRNRSEDEIDAAMRLAASRLADLERELKEYGDHVDRWTKAHDAIGLKLEAAERSLTEAEGVIEGFRRVERLLSLDTPLSVVLPAFEHARAFLAKSSAKQTDSDKSRAEPKIQIREGET